MDFKDGEVLLVNKPYKWTSFDVVKKIRYAIRKKLGVKNIKVGHAGTLDPLAEGLLIICTGKKTKEIEQFMGLPKTYSGTIFLGATTPSYDLESEVNQHFPINHINEDMVRTTAEKMVGEQNQYPPIFSAKRVDGKRAYDLARQGIDVILKPKLITVHSFEITAIELPLIHFRISCSKGTYIRSIANDFGKLLNNGGYLKALKREKIGHYDLNSAYNIENLIELIGSSDTYQIDSN